VRQELDFLNVFGLNYGFEDFNRSCGNVRISIIVYCLFHLPLNPACNRYYVTLTARHVPLFPEGDRGQPERQRESERERESRSRSFYIMHADATLQDPMGLLGIIT
jgi:hypothetical protein